MGWWGGGGSLRDLSKNILKQRVSKGKSCSKGGGFLKVSPPLSPPLENFNHAQGNILQITKHLETNTTRKQSKENNRQNYNVIKLSPQRSANKYGSTTIVNQSETTQKYFDPLRTHKYNTHTHTHTPCPMMGEVSLETSPKNKT